jgi:hypothetical protein
MTDNGKPPESAVGFIMLRDSFVLNEVRKLPPRAVVVLLILLQHADRNRQAYPSLDRLAEIMGASCARTAARAIDELVEAGILTKTERPGSSWLYTIDERVIPPDEKTPDKSVTPSQSRDDKPVRGTPDKSVTSPPTNLSQESYSKNHTQLNQRDDHLCSWNKKLVPVSQLKDWCTQTFTKSPDGRAAIFTRKHLDDHPDTRELLLRVGVLALAGAIPEACIQDGCEALRHVKRWPDNPGGYLRTVWSKSQHKPTGSDNGWFAALLAGVELPDGI